MNLILESLLSVSAESGTSGLDAAVSHDMIANANEREKIASQRMRQVEKRAHVVRAQIDRFDRYLPPPRASSAAAWLPPCFFRDV